ncbi:1614_t:CDS:2 [Rhizophagus irregularis]|nr:1614_t:CDS:2 [Rhizophagus irregularis]
MVAKFIIWVVKDYSFIFLYFNFVIKVLIRFLQLSQQIGPIITGKEVIWKPWCT